MSSRETILHAIRQHKPAETPLPQPFYPTQTPDWDLTNKYLEILQSIGGKGRVVSDPGEVEAFLMSSIQSGVEVINGLEGLPHYNIGSCINRTPEELASVQTVFLRGRIAVAENASIWVPEESMSNRLLPFICQELVLVIEQKDIVANMHEAYKRTRIDENGYGVFIAGPSKTADIEQSLVIGAHGPLSLQVLILETASIL